MKHYGLLLALLICCLQTMAQPPAIQVSVTGKGTPILFLPGFACSGRVWHATVEQLSSGYQAHVITYAGFDGLTPIDTPWYSSLKLALMQYIANLSQQQVYVVGHSMGGNLATDLAAALPEKISKILLVDAIPCMRELMMPGVIADKVAYNAPYNTRLLNLNQHAMEQYARMMASNMTTAKANADTLVQWMMQADRKTFVYGYVDLLKLDQRTILPGIRADVLILGATFPNKEVVQANYDKQYSSLAQKQIVYADNSKHFIMHDQPEWFYHQLNAFLAK